mgnify:CR=1 FL=1
MTSELKKRLITSIILIILLFLMYQYSFVLIISLIIISVLAWIEFYALVSKIFTKNNLTQKVLRFFLKALSLLYLSILVYFVLITTFASIVLKTYLFYSILVSVLSDIGGLIVGKIVKGKKLTNISPNKTVSGSVGSFIFALSLIPFFSKYFYLYDLSSLIIITILISLTSQLGDLFISLLKRKANVEDTSNLLPGHGGILDRIDGIIFAIPMGFLLFSIL